MAIITRHNYEAFFIDYIEGNLNFSRKKEFYSFLESNPDIKEELQSWEEVKINPEKNIEFPEKNTLKKTHSVFPKESPFEELCIAKTEGDLTIKEASLFDQYIKEEPEKAKLYNLYKKTKLTPDKSIVFPEKEKLKVQKSKLVKLANVNYQYILAFAASIALIIGLIFNFSTNSSTNKHRYSNLKDFNDNITIFATIKNSESNNRFTTKYISDSKDLISINNYLLPVAKVKNNNIFTSSNNSISKIKPTYFSELKTASENEFITELHTKPDPKMLLADRSAKSKKTNTRKGTNINSINPSNTKAQPNRFLLDIANLGFKSISKLTGKEIELERTYNKSGNLKRLAFKTESFSISTKINE